MYFAQWKKYALLTGMIFLLAAHSPAQHRRDSLLPSKRSERISFGFCVGASNFLIKLKEADIYHVATGYQDSIQQISAKGSLGLTMGMVIDVRVHSGFYLRFSPAVLFNNYVVYYSRMNGRTDLMYSQNSFLELPLHLEYKFNRTKWVPVIAAGSSFKFDYTRSDNGFAQTRFWSLDIAAAVEKKIGQITVIPGIRYAQALSDVWVSRRMEIPGLIDHVRLHTIYFTITFRG